MRRRKSERNPFAWKRILEQFWKNCMIGKIVRETLRYPKRYAIKRFETTGQISLLSLTKLAMALELADELRDLFTQVPYRNIQEVINESKGKS